MPPVLMLFIWSLALWQSHSTTVPPLWLSRDYAYHGNNKAQRKKTPMSPTLSASKTTPHSLLSLFSASCPSTISVTCLPTSRLLDPTSFVKTQCWRSVVKYLHYAVYNRGHRRCTPGLHLHCAAKVWWWSSGS